MGVYRMIEASLSCARCGTVYVETVQFKTGCDHQMERYTEGQRVKPDRTLKIGEVYEGIGFAHCGPCDGLLTRTERVAEAEVQADLIDAGDLELGDPPLTAPALRAQAARIAREPMRREHPLLFVIDPSPGQRTVWRGRDAAKDLDAHLAYQQALKAGVQARLAADGWGDQFRDVVVRLDEDGRIRLGTVGGAPR